MTGTRSYWRVSGILNPDTPRDPLGLASTSWSYTQLLVTESVTPTTPNCWQFRWRVEGTPLKLVTAARETIKVGTPVSGRREAERCAGDRYVVPGYHVTVDDREIVHWTGQQVPAQVQWRGHTLSVDVAASGAAGRLVIEDDARREPFIAFQSQEYLFETRAVTREEVELGEVPAAPAGFLIAGVLAVAWWMRRYR